MPSPKFELGTNVLQFSRGLKYPLDKPHEKAQVTDRAADGSLQREDLGVDIRRRLLVFRNLPQVDFDQLNNWYDNICNGVEHEFTYFDEKGQSMQVLLLTNPLRFPESYQGRFSGTLELEVVG